jgi:hypothetical protein
MGCVQGSFGGGESAEAKRTADPAATVVVCTRQIGVYPPGSSEGGKAMWANYQDSKAFTVS